MWVNSKYVYLSCHNTTMSAMNLGNNYVSKECAKSQLSHILALKKVKLWREIVLERYTHCLEVS